MIYEPTGSAGVSPAPSSIPDLAFALLHPTGSVGVSPAPSASCLEDAGYLS
jgi:hypothetical protein